MPAAAQATIATVAVVAVACTLYYLRRRPAGAAKPRDEPLPGAASAAGPPETSTRNGHSAAPAKDAAAAAAASPRVKKKQKKAEAEAEAVKKKAAAPVAAAKAGAEATEVPSEGEPFVNSVVSRAVLTQPVDLLAAANPPSAKADSAKPKPGDKKKKEKQKPISSWAEGFMAAMQTLEGTAVDAALRAQQQLTGCLASANKPGAPRDALSITLRGLGFVLASMGQMAKAEAAYKRACTDAQRRSGDSGATLGCWRDLAVLAREQGDHEEAARCWREAARTLLAAQAAEAKARPGEQRRGAAGGEQAAAAARLELELCKADCLREQGRFAEAEEIARAALAWRDAHLGAAHPASLGAVFDVARIVRAKAYAAALAAAEAADEAAPAPAGEADGGAAADDDEPAADDAADDDPAAVARSARVAVALAAMDGAAAELDARWLAGLRELCAREAEHKWAEHVNMLASVSQLHKDWKEAVFLFRLAHPALEQLHGSAGLDYAELLNSQGECLLELRCYTPAAPAFAAAHDVVTVANGAEDPSVASIEANQATVLSAMGHADAADALFQGAAARMRESVAAHEGEPPAGGEGGEEQTLFMVQVMNARVLKLYAAHEERVGGREAHAAELKAEAKRLEVTYGFTS